MPGASHETQSFIRMSCLACCILRIHILNSDEEDDARTARIPLMKNLIFAVSDGGLDRWNLRWRYSTIIDGGVINSSGMRVAHRGTTRTMRPPPPSTQLGGRFYGSFHNLHECNSNLQGTFASMEVVIACIKVVRRFQGIYYLIAWKK